MKFILYDKKIAGDSKLGEREVLGIYEVLGSFYAFTVGTKPDLDFALKVFEVIPSSYLPNDDNKERKVFNDAMVWGINPSNSIISNYLKKVYLANIQEFYVKGVPFRLPDELEGFPEKYKSEILYTRVMKPVALSSDEICKLRDDLMYDGDAVAIVLDRKDYQEKKKKAQTQTGQYTTPILRRGKILIKEV